MDYFKNIEEGYIVSISTVFGETKIEKSEYDNILSVIESKPTAPDGYAYRLRADTLSYELVELPPEPEPYPTVEDKAEAYDILMGVSE